MQERCVLTLNPLSSDSCAACGGRMLFIDTAQWPELSSLDATGLRNCTSKRIRQDLATQQSSAARLSQTWCIATGQRATLALNADQDPRPNRAGTGTIVLPPARPTAELLAKVSVQRFASHQRPSVHVSMRTRPSAAASNRARRCLLLF